MIQILYFVAAMSQKRQTFEGMWCPSILGNAASILFELISTRDLTDI